MENGCHESASLRKHRLGTIGLFQQWHKHGAAAHQLPEISRSQTLADVWDRLIGTPEPLNMKNFSQRSGAVS